MKYTVLVILILFLWACTEEAKVESETPTVESSSVQNISFENYFQKISYAIGLDHGSAGRTVYYSDKLKGKFNVIEIKNGLVDYLATNPLKIKPNDTDSILALYLVEDGSIDTSKISKEIGSYAVGVNEAIVLVSTFVARGIDQEIDAALLIKGIEDGLSGEKTSYNLEKAQLDIATYYAEVNLKNGEDFLKYNAQKEGVIVTASGLQYQVFETGKGGRPNSTDSVVVHYTGRFINGQEFESSIPSGQPARLSLLSVVPGWSEGVKLMNIGAKYRFFIPADLGFGETGSGPIEPNATLVFDIELLDIIKYVPNY